MKKKLSFVVLCLLSFIGVQAQLSSNPDKFLGNITTNGNVDYSSAEKFYQLWNQITPENESKWDAIEPSRGNFTFGGADRSSSYAKQHHFPFKYHTLIWGAQYPSWMNDLSTAEQYQAIVEYFDEVKKHYPNLEIIDVVNEAISGHQPAPYRAALGGEGRSGYDWIVKAFQLAHERWPNAILVYNDYNTFQWNTQQFITLVQTLRDAGAPIDAYGCQSHDLTDISLSNFKNVMNQLQTALKMPMYSTEFDIGTADDNKQATQYKDLIPVLWEADYCAGVTLWGWIYGHTWTTDGNSGLIKETTENGKTVFKDRPAMTWLREYMQTDAAKNAKSPFPGFKKEFSVYVKPASTKVAKGDKLPVWVDATAATKTIEKVELYNGTELIGTMTGAPYIFEFTSASTGTKTLKAVVTATDGSTWERIARVQVLTATTVRAPYNNVVPELPGVVDAMEYDEGAAGVSYNNAARTGETKTGGWMEYTVDVKEAGLYSVDIEVSSATNGGMFHLVDNYFGNMVFLSDFVTVPNTAGETKTFHLRLTTELEAGRRTLGLIVDNGGFSIGKMTFTKSELNSSMRVSVKADPATINVGETTKITATANVGSSSSIANVRIFVNDMLLTTLTEKPYTVEFTPTVKGTYTITNIATDAQGRESKIAKTTLTVKGVRAAFADLSLPGTIQFEDFDKGGEGMSFHDADSKDDGGAKYRDDNEGVDIVAGNGGYAIGYTAADEWMEYTVNVTKTGTYNCEAWVASGTTGASFTLSLRDNGRTTQLGSFSIPQTASGSWDTYAVVKTKLSQELPEGQHTLRVTITGANGNLDKMVFTLNEGGEEEQPTEVDPNFYIYICFGQSNMEGNAQWEAQDVGNVDERFQMLATCNFSNPQRTLGNWYTAECPIVSPDGKLGPTDYFGRTMVEQLPDKKIGVIAVAMGGSPIEMFDKDLYAQKMSDNPNEWWVTLAKRHYGGNPYGRIIEMAKKAQQVGVIKGILLHQGESNNGDPNWPNMVKKIYNDMLRDLGLKAADVPIFVGETEYEEMGGGCSWHNTVVAKIPEVIPTGHVVSAKDIPGNGTDPWHFSAEGYRIFGKRYAQVALDVMNHPYAKYYAIDERLTGTLSNLTGKAFAIVNEEEQKAFYCPAGQQLGYDTYQNAFNVKNDAFLFRVSRVSSGRGLRLVTPDGNEYQVDGTVAYLNSQAVTGDYCFVNGLNGQRGYEIPDGALWTLEYVDGKGWSLKNTGTGKYLKDASHPAMFDEPTYFTFCTLIESATGIKEVYEQPTSNAFQFSDAVFNLQGVKVGTKLDWNTLPKGMYIIDGKLMMKR